MPKFDLFLEVIGLREEVKPPPKPRSSDHITNSPIDDPPFRTARAIFHNSCATPATECIYGPADLTIEEVYIVTS